MPSPFPGMNPCLEHPGVWHDFYRSFNPAFNDALVPQVRPRFIVQIVPQTVREESCDRPSIDEERLGVLEIRDRESRKLITVIELLSPPNKDGGGGSAQYLGKRENLILSGVNFVEIDLMRGGTRPPILRLPACDYYVMAARPQDWPHVGLWPLKLRDRLPRIPIPLKPTDRDAEIDLQPLVEGIYDRAGYEDYVYSTSPEPPRSPTGSAWVTERLAAAGAAGLKT